MLVLSRKVGERIQVGDDVTITVVRINPNSVRIGIDAAPEVVVMREELAERALASGGEDQARLPLEPR
jgi:carbon storage regulator